MSKIFQDTTYEPTIALEQIEGNLRIKGWDRPEVRFDADNLDDLEITQDGVKFNVHCRSNLYLRLPTTAVIEIKNVQGDVNFKSVEGDIYAGLLEGNANFKLLGSIEIDSLQGNLTANRMEGSLKASSVDGNVTIRDVEETLLLQTVKGNFNFRGMSKAIECKVSGNANIRMETEPDGHYKINSGGNINCRVEIPTGANIELSSHAENILVETQAGPEAIKAAQHIFSVGEGDADIKLEADGNLNFIVATLLDDLDDTADFDYAEDLTSLADDITQQVTDQIEAQMDSLNEQLSSLSEQFGGPGAEKAQGKVHQAQRKLELKLAATQRRAERQVRKAAQQARRGRPRFAMGVPINLTKSKSEPVSDGERQAILQMLQDQKITVEEAEMLLAALEGELDTSNEIPQAPEPPESPTPPPAPKAE